MLPDTLWVISGQLHWSRELAENIKPHLLKPFPKEDLLEFLTKSKVEPPGLREEIFKLTESYPLYLDVCVDFYEEYLSKNGYAPPIDDLRLIIDGLAILGTWTDDAELLQTRYEEKLFGYVRNLIDVYEVLTAEDIITAFQDKVIELDGKENIPSYSARNTPKL